MPDGARERKKIKGGKKTGGENKSEGEGEKKREDMMKG